MIGESIHTSNMTLENYIKWFNEVVYPKNYPYYLRMGLRASNNKLSLTVQIGIPIVINDNFDINSKTNYEFQDVLTIYGDSDKEIIKTFEALEFSHDHKEYFKSLWKK